MLTLAFIVALFFVIIFSVLLELIVRCPLIVAGIVALISLIVFAIFFDTLGLIFIAWIVIYTITAFITALITCRLIKRHRDKDCF